MKSANYWIVILFCLLCCLPSNLHGQEGKERLEKVEERLDILVENGIPLEKEITISLEGSIQELVSFLSESTDLNVSIDPNVRQRVSVSFTEVRVRDVILHLCDMYSLDLRPTGKIVNLIPYVPAPPEVVEEPLNVDFDPSSGLLSLRLSRDTLIAVAQKITELTGRNVAVDQMIQNLKISGFINGLPLNSALQQIAESNGLIIEEKSDFIIFKQASEEDVFGSKPNKSDNDQDVTDQIYIKRVGTEEINIKAVNINILDLAIAVGEELEVNYAILPNASRQDNDSRAGGRRTTLEQGISSSRETVSVQLTNVNYYELLKVITKNSPYYFELQNDKYVIGEREAESLRATKVVQLQFRSARGIEYLIPERMLEGVQIDSLYELNSVILSGSRKNVNEVAIFLNEIDRTVPVVMIELTIVDVQVSQLDDLGVEAGVADDVPTGGTILGEGGLDFTFSSGAINDFLGILGERGIINLGQVTPDFYLTLRALQESGVIDIKSTPRLSTLNSHTALLKIGQKRYFQEQQVNFPGLDRPIPVQANIFREVEANLEIRINPLVSGDDEVTLDVEYIQSEFVGDPGPLAPPPQVSRQFASMIRVRNGETVVLGGLERESKSKTRRGIPWLSKIPGLGWLFGRTNSNKREEKLLIFIKPTVVN